MHHSDINIYMHIYAHIHPSKHKYVQRVCIHWGGGKGAGPKRDDQAYDLASMLGDMLHHICELKRRGPLNR